MGLELLSKEYGALIFKSKYYIYCFYNIIVKFSSMIYYNIYCINYSILIIFIVRLMSQPCAVLRVATDIIKHSFVTNYTAGIQYMRELKPEAVTIYRHTLFRNAISLQCFPSR